MHPMILTTWNIRGLNDPLKQQEVLQFLLAHRVDCGAIIETHVKNNAIKEISKVFTGFQLIHNNDYHHNYRIWVLWKPHIISLTVLHKSAQHIHCSLLHLASQRRVEVTFLYAYNARSYRRDLWKALLDISTQATLPWLCLGDFNVVLKMDERLGSTQLNLADMNEFSQCLDTCALVDHPATGCHFTWNNRHGSFTPALQLEKLETPLAAFWIRLGSCVLLVRVQEILEALRSIDMNKSSGVDGYTSGFFLDAWTVVGQDFKNVVLEFFQTGVLPKAANTTLLVLIPKMETPLSVKDFRPIACCTTYYKVVSKILANRLRQVLDVIVGPEQAAFVVERDIFDNSLLGHELVSKYGRAYLTPRCLLKVDIRKAFDSVNWDFLKESLLLLNFPSKFVHWIMACVTSPNYSLLINGGVEGFFPGKCGLRQGDPLSPYLFVICMEVLSRLLRRLHRAPNFSYHPKCVQLNLTHLVFADDLLVFTRGDLPSVKAVANCLELFSELPGLHANLAKTYLYFGGVADGIRDLILAETRFSAGEFPFKYLGLPLFNARITQDMYQPLLDKINARYMHWANKNLSYAGKTLLVNSIIFGLNNFWGANVLLPRGISKRSNKLCKDFIWGIDEGCRRHTFLKWQLLCSPKTEGGIGIKKVLSWNNAQMVKRVWKLIYRPHSIWSRWVYTYVLKGHDFWLATTNISHSWYWNNVIKMKDLLLGITGSPAHALQLLEGCSTNLRYNTSLMYDSIRSCRPKVSWHNLVHGKGCHPKHSFVGMMVMHNALPTIDNLMRRGLLLVNRCALYENCSEDVHYIFFNCPYSRHLLHTIGTWLELSLRSCFLFTIVQEFASKRSTCRQRVGFLATIYYLWNERNDRIFKGVKSSVDTLSVKIKRAVHLRLYGSGLS
ncbi:uncharacterized protein LOC141588551 [Silene latifolia]|uniref:uncharacterized protein LOC141588551 n=1 Tax=Silene latifolia TaxID=37657 RepID=UPI003D783895